MSCGDPWSFEVPSRQAEETEENDNAQWDYHQVQLKEMQEAMVGLSPSELLKDLIKENPLTSTDTTKDLTSLLRDADIDEMNYQYCFSGTSWEPIIISDETSGTSTELIALKSELEELKSVIDRLKNEVSIITNNQPIISLILNDKTDETVEKSSQTAHDRAMEILK